MTINTLQLIKELLRFSPREYLNETKTGKFLTAMLVKNKIAYRLQKFTFKIPVEKKAQLLTDGHSIPCQAITFTSGVISGKSNLISNQIEAAKSFPFISFNPTGDSISASGRSINYPALAIAKKDIIKVLQAKNVRGVVKVQPTRHQSQNILVGNLDNPQAIIFTHYDSINCGATDNASGTAVTLKLILENPKLLSRNLFVLSGNEELAYDFPIYWGYGYRVFEKKYLGLLKKTKKILILDCVGNGKTQFLSDPHWVNEGFPIKNIKRFLPKTAMVCGDIKKLMTVYHSQADDLSQLSKKYLDEAYNQILKSFSFLPLKRRGF